MKYISPKYLIIKREECDCEYGYRQDWDGRNYICDCVDHKRETQIDADEWLLDRLKALRFNLDNANYVGLKQLGEVRFED